MACNQPFDFKLFDILSDKICEQSIELNFETIDPIFFKA